MTLAPPSDLQIATPRVRTVARRSLFWIGIAVVALVVTAVIVFSAAGTGTKPSLSASNPSPNGAQALARVLVQNGVHVTESPDLASTVAAAGSADTTVLLYDPGSILTTGQRERLASLPSDLVLVQPTDAQLAVLDPDVLPAGTVQGTLQAGCALPAAQRAGTITGDGFGYRLADGADAGSVTCFDSGDDIHSLVVSRAGSHTVTVIGSTAVLADETITREGNAALALGVLGARENLVWYLPGDADAAARTQPPTVGDLIPAWFTPLMVLLLVVAALAAVWRSRRLGPLVVERLPVVVRASETMEGRARLYAKNSTRLHALDAIRVGTIARLALLRGLPRTSSVDDVVTAVADVLGRDPSGIRALLVDAQPRSDADLVRMSDDLTRLERAVRALLRPGSPTEG